MCVKRMRLNVRRRYMSIRSFDRINYSDGVWIMSVGGSYIAWEWEPES